MKTNPIENQTANASADIYAKFIELSDRLNRYGKCALVENIEELLDLAGKIHQDIQTRNAYVPADKTKPPTCICGAHGIHAFRAFHYSQIISMIQCRDCGAFYMPKIEQLYK